MLLPFEFLLRSVLIIILVAIIIFAIYSKLVFNYWKKRDVPQLVKPWLFLGTVPDLMLSSKYAGLYFKHHYDIGKSRGYKHAGYFIATRPVYVPFSLEYIKNIFQKDFNYFSDRGIYYNEKDDPISVSLFTLGGEKWRKLRAKLSPAYTPKKLKELFDSLLQCAIQMRDSLEQTYQNKLSIDLKELAECFTVDAIGSSVFGLECNSFKNSEAEFKKQGKKALTITWFRSLKIICSYFLPRLSQWLGIALFERESNIFFINVVKNSLKHRKEHGSGKKNFLELLFELKSSDEAGNITCLTVEELAAQVFSFFTAGFETSSITITFCLYELSINQTIQNKLREEINRILKEHNGNITYDAVMDMKYLDQVVQETLRKYPPTSFIPRETSQDYTIPGTTNVIEKGVLVYIPVLALHHDPEYYPEPDKFDPERFNEENNKLRKPYTYIPFGDGPRICIGLRFGLLEIKVSLVTLLREYKFLLNKKTKDPIEMDLMSFTLTPKHKIYLDIIKVL